MAQYGQGEPLGASYRLVELLGSGATGEVWRVEHTATGVQYAAKLLRAELAADPEIVERFVRERSVLLALQHPSIVRVQDLVVEGDRLAIVMDLVAGGSTRDLLVAEGTLAPRDALVLTAETLDALAAAHSNDVTHRDVKPDNVLLAAPFASGTTGAVRVTDFGIASVVAERDRRTTGLLGTPQYMAPESISHGRSGPAADVYGAGVMLYEFLAGRTPFAGTGTDFAVAYRHVTSNPPRIDVPDVSALGWNYVTAYGGEFQTLYGTSASTVVIASMISRVNNARLLAGKRPVGWLNKVLYDHPEIFNDIKKGGGKNSGCGVLDAFVTEDGWDPVTGLGSLHFEKLLALYMSLP